MTFINISRRTFLKSGAAAGIGLSAPMHFVRGAWAQDMSCNMPTGDTVTYGLNLPLTGAYADEGADELKAFQLAIKHLNGEGDGGMIKTMKPTALKGNGILGKKVAFVQSDSQTKSDAARDGAKRMIERDGAIMISGGSSSGEAVAVQGLCQELGIVFMAGLTHSNDTTGKDKKRYGFRHFFNAYQSGVALAPVLADAYGKDRKAYHLTADYTWGWTQEESIKAATEKLGWETVTAVRTPLGAADFSQYITPVLNSGADVLILNHYGKDMVNSLTQAVQFGLREKDVNGKKFEIVVPLFSELMAGRRRCRQGHLRDGQLGLEAGRRGDQGLHQVVRSRIRHAPLAGRANLLRPVAALCRRLRAGRHLLRAGSHQGARRLRVRRHGQRPDALPRRRPSVLQVLPGAEGQGESEGQVRPRGSGQGRAARGADLRRLDLRRRARAFRRQAVLIAA